MILKKWPLTQKYSINTKDGTASIIDVTISDGVQITITQSQIEKCLTTLAELDEFGLRLQELCKQARKEAGIS